MKKAIIWACAGLCAALGIAILILIQIRHGGKSGAEATIASVFYTGFCLLLKEATEE